MGVYGVLVIDMGYFTKVIRKLLILIITLIAIYLSFKLALFYMPFLIGFIISLLIEPVIKFVNKKTKLTRKASAITVMLCIFTILITLIVFGAITLITESSNLLQSLNIYIEKIYNQIQRYINTIEFDRMEIPSQVISIVQTSTNNLLDFISKWISSFLTSIIQGITSLPIIGIYIVITILSTYFICADKLYILDQLEHHFPRIWVKKFGMHLKKLIATLGGYLKAEATLILISFIEVLIGLYIFKWIGLNVGYPLLAALGIAFVDALPILRLWNCNDTLGHNISLKWRFKIRNSSICSICNNISCTPNIRAKNSKWTYRSSSNIYTYCYVYGF